MEEIELKDVQPWLLESMAGQLGNRMEIVAFSDGIARSSGKPFSETIVKKGVRVILGSKMASVAFDGKGNAKVKRLSKCGDGDWAEIKRWAASVEAEGSKK